MLLHIHYWFLSDLHQHCCFAGRYPLSVEPILCQLSDLLLPACGSLEYGACVTSTAFLLRFLDRVSSSQDLPAVSVRPSGVGTAWVHRSCSKSEVLMTLVNCCIMQVGGLFSSCESGCPPLSALRWIVIQARDSLRLRFFPLTMHHRDWAASAEVKSGNAGGKKETLEKINKRKKKKKDASAAEAGIARCNRHSVSRSRLCWRGLCAFSLPPLFSWGGQINNG